MRHASHRPRSILAIAGALVLVTATFAAPVLAKEGLAAELDVPVAGGTPGGTTLLIGMTVTVLDEGTRHLVDGTPIYVRLIGPDGAATRALAQQGAPGHYTARVEVPGSGVADIEVGINGSTDLPLAITGTAVVPGAITAGTAQVAPIVTRITPVSRASAAAPPVAARPAVAPPAVVPAAQPAASAWVAPILLGAGLVALALLIAGSVVANRRSRSAGRLAVSDRVREA